MKVKISLSIILKNRILHHILFWASAYYSLLKIFTSTTSIISKVDYIYTAIFQILLIVAVYINLYVLIPAYLSKKRYFLYSVFITINIAVFSLLNIELFAKWVDYILPGYYFISYYEFIDIIKFFAVFITITTLLKLSKGWFLLVEAKQNLLQLQGEKKDAELSALKAQINPHFLFNSLNSIYSLSLSKSEKTPEIILKISDILRYIIYESTDTMVSLEKEVDLIRNYIDVQKLRSDGNVTTTFQVNGDLEGKRIAPLLLFPLVENSFKHGVKGRIKDSYIDILLSVQNDQIIFIIENNKGVVDNVEKNKFGGIGLDNIQKRLNAIYNNRYTIRIADNQDTYRVELQIPNS